MKMKKILIKKTANIQEDMAGDFRVNKEALKKANQKLKDLSRLSYLLEDAIAEATKNGDFELVDRLNDEKAAIDNAIVELEDKKEEIERGEYDPEADEKEAQEKEKERSNKDEEEPEGEKEGEGDPKTPDKNKDDKKPRKEPQQPDPNHRTPPEEKQKSYIPKPGAFENEPETPEIPTGPNGERPREGGQGDPGTPQTPQEPQEGSKEEPTTGEGGQNPGGQGKEKEGSQKQNNQGQKNNGQQNQENGPEQQNTKITNPFAPAPGAIQGNGKMTPEDIGNYLKTLPPEAKEAAIKGIQNVLNKKAANEGLNKKKSQNRLTEETANDKLKDIWHWTDHSFNNYYNDVTDLINKAFNGRAKVIDDPSANIKEIQSLIDDPMEMQELVQELTNDSADERSRLAAETEKAKFNEYEPLSNFWMSFYRAINDQIKTYQEEKETWLAYNNIADEDNRIDKGERKEDIEDIEKPTIHFFYDRSNSWCDDTKAIDLGNRIYKTFIDEEEKGNIFLKPWYFSGIVTDNEHDGRLDGNTAAWNEIIQTIEDWHAYNVVLLTDSDLPGWEPHMRSIKVPGCVWIIYRDDGREKDKQRAEIPKHLQGRQGTTEYMFDSSQL